MINARPFAVEAKLFVLRIGLGQPDFTPTGETKADMVRWSRAAFIGLS